MSEQLTKADLEYQIRKLERNREEVKRMEQQYRPGTKQYEAYFTQGAALDSTIRQLQGKITFIADLT